MNKLLHALVYVILVLAAASVYFEVNLYKKRDLLGDRNRAMEDMIVRIAKTIETSDAPKSTNPPEIKKDISQVEDRIVDNPDTENLLEEYPVHLEQQNLATFNWDNAESRKQLRRYYHEDEFGQVVPDETNYGEPSTTGEDTMSALLNSLFDRAVKQQSLLNTTRAELSAMRAKLEKLVPEYNQLKNDDRADKVTITELKAKIAQLEEDKSNLEAQVEKLKNQIEDLNGEITSLKDELQRAKDDVEAFKEDLEKEKKRSAQLQKTIQALTRQMSEQQQANGATVAANLTAGDKGKIIRVDNDKMFVIVEFDDNTMAQLLGKDRSGFLPQLDLGVKRSGFEGPAGEFVGRIRLRVAVDGKNFVIADVLGDWVQAKIEEGDIVFTE